MDNKQAIEEIKRWTPTLLSLGETCTNHTMEAQQKAIASLEAWGKIKEELEKEYIEDRSFRVKVYQLGISKALDIINKHLGE